jgi:L-malate glycosyltransferase
MQGTLDRTAKLRVLHVVLQLSLGGAESMVALLARHLEPRRFDVSVWGLDEGGATAESLASAGIDVAVLDKGPGFRLSFLGELRRRLRSLRPDVVHAHNTPAARWMALATFGLAPAPILVRTEHTYNPAKRFEHILSHAILGSRYTAIVGVAESVTDHHRRLDPLWRKRWITIPNGIEIEGGRESPTPDIAKRAELGLDPARGLVVNLGNLRPPKGQSHLLRAFAGVADRFPDVDLAILGEGSLRQELQSLAQSLEIHARVHFAGHRPDAAALLGAADVVVQASTREGMPVSLLEAARMCRPIVATDAGGTREFVIDGQTGLLVPPADPNALAAALERLLADPGEAGRLALGARRRLIDRHDIRDIAGQTGELYTGLLGRG